jgi:hypothetical protein
VGDLCDPLSQLSRRVSLPMHYDLQVRPPFELFDHTGSQSNFQLCWRLLAVLTRLASSNIPRADCRAISRFSQSWPRGCPFLLQRRSSSSLRVGSASALKTLSASIRLTRAGAGADEHGRGGPGQPKGAKKANSN